MALDEAAFERISSTRVFGLMRDGAIKSYQLLEDLLGRVRRDVLIAGGAVKPDKSPPTFADVMGREPVPLIDPPAKTPAEEAAEEERRLETAAMLALAQLQHYEATIRRARPDIIEGDPP
jgi:hypothetical protein